MLEPQFQQADPWIFPTATPSFTDVALYAQLSWGKDIAIGRGIEDLTAGELPDTQTEGVDSFFDGTRYPALHRWFTAMKDYVANLPSTESKSTSAQDALEQMRNYKLPASAPLLLPTPANPHRDLDKQAGLVSGIQVSVAPDDTGRDE